MSEHVPTLQAGQQFGERYTLLGELGVGGAGAVYRAFDRERDEEVGLKLLRREVATHATARVRFMREFRAIARLQHPNCLRVFDEGKIDGSHYYTMEFIEGGDLEKYQRAPREQLFDLLYQVTIALAHIHEHRIVHRDLKPANILVHDVGGGELVAKLADFGIAKELDSDQVMTQTGAMMGTVGYMSPEQICGEAIDPRSDLYALGCIIHTLFTGQPPFVHPKGSFHVLRAHLEVAAPRLSERIEDVPEELDELVASLLAKKPGERPQSALAVLDVLNRVRGGDEREASSPNRAASVLYRPTMVGRQREREELVDAIASMHRRDAGELRPVFASLCSPAGMGKSRLVEALKKDLSVRGVTVLTASVESNPDALFSPFPEAEASIARAIAADLDWDVETMAASEGTRDGVPPGDLPTRQGVALETSPSAMDPDIARRERARDLVHDLERLSKEAPVLLVLEDLHASREGAIDFLKDVLRALRGPLAHPPALLITLRPGRVRQLLDDLSKEIPSINVELDPLGASEIEEILAQMLGQAQDTDLLDHLVNRVLAQTEGNPLFVQAYLQNIVEQKALKRTREGWTYEGDESTGDIVPRTMAQVLGERLSMLEPQTYNVLRAASAVGRIFDFALLREILDIEEGELLDAIDEALRTWVIRSIDGPRHLDTYTFDHAKFVDALYEDMSPSRQRSLHQRVGLCLERREGTSAQALASHFARGEDPHKAYNYLTKAGMEALGEHDHALALEHFDGALALLDDITLDDTARAVSRASLLEARADALAALGRQDEAAEALAIRLSANPPRIERVRLERKRARALTLAGHTREGIDAFEAILEDLGDSIPATRVMVWVRLVTLFLGSWLFRFLPGFTGRKKELVLERALIHRELMVQRYWLDLERSTFHQFIYMQLAARLDDASLLVDAYASHLLLANMLRMERRARRYHRRAEDAAGSLGDVLGQSRVSGFTATAHAFLAEHDKFMSVHPVAVERAERAQDRFNLAFTWTTGGWSATLVDEIAYARSLFEKTVALGDEMGSDRLRADGLSGLCAVEVLDGEPIEERAREVLAIGERLQMHAHRGLGHELIGAHHFFQHEFRDAVESFRTSRQIYVDHRLFGAWGFMIGYEFAESLLHAVDLEGGAMRDKDLRDLKENIRVSQLALRSLPPFRGFYETLEGTVAARQGKERRALSLFARAEKMRMEWPEHYLTGWVLQRIAIEKAGLGRPRSEFEPLLARYEEIFEGSEFAGGLGSLIQLVRRIIAQKTS